MRSKLFARTIQTQPHLFAVLQGASPGRLRRAWRQRDSPHPGACCPSGLSH